MLIELYPRFHARFSSLPLLGPHLNDFVVWLRAQGYPRLPIRRRVRETPRVDARLRRRGVRRVEDLSRTGFFVRSAMLPVYGARIESMLKTPSGQLIAVKGMVQWNTASVTSKGRESGFGVCVTTHGAEYVGFVEGVIAAGELIPALVLAT